MTRLGQWLSEQVGKGRRFRTARQLSLAAGLSQSMVGIIMERGQTTPDTLVKIARALDVNPAQLFVMVGWLRETEVKAPSDPEERELLEGYRHLSPEARAMLLGGVREARAHYHVKDAPGQVEEQRRRAARE